MPCVGQYNLGQIERTAESHNISKKAPALVVDDFVWGFAAPFQEAAEISVNHASGSPKHSWSSCAHAGSI